MNNRVQDVVSGVSIGLGNWHCCLECSKYHRFMISFYSLLQCFDLLWKVCHIVMRTVVDFVSITDYEVHSRHIISVLSRL